MRHLSRREDTARNVGQQARQWRCDNVSNEGFACCLQVGRAAISGRASVGYSCREKIFSGPLKRDENDGGDIERGTTEINIEINDICVM